MLQGRSKSLTGHQKCTSEQIANSLFRAVLCGILHTYNVAGTLSFIQVKVAVANLMG